jgi:hypothetical protein
MKIVINACYGGFGLSDRATRRYAELKGLKLIEKGSRAGEIDFYVDEVKPENYFYIRTSDRSDPVLVQVVEELGDGAGGRYAQLRVVEIPDDVKWEIEEYDGREWIAEVHRTWR